MKKALLLFLFALSAVFAMAQSTKIDPTVLLRASGTNSRFLATDGSGNVTWVQGSSLLTGGTGISISGNTITNSAPDQTVSLTGAGATAVTGTYPSFTITTNALATIQDEGSGLTQRAALNFIGAAVSAADNAGSSRTDVSFDAEVNGIAALSGTGLVVQTGAGTFVNRTLALANPGLGFSFGQSNLDGVAGNPTLNIDAGAFAWHQSARAVATTNQTLSGNPTLDGVTLVTGDRILLTGQTTASENGLWVTAAGAWSRPTDADAGTDFQSGQVIFVREGTAGSDGAWVLSTDGTITPGTTSLTYRRIGRAGQATAGSYGSATQIPVFTLNSDGTISSVTNTTLTESQTLTASDGSGSDRTINLTGGSSVTLAQGSGISLTRSGNTITVAASASAPAVTIQRFEDVPVSNTTTTTVSGFTPLTTDTEVFLDGVMMDWGAGEDITVSGQVVTFSRTVSAGQKILVKKITVN
jgi:hypothetical protein